MAYKKLKDALIIQTIGNLQARISTRFPDSGLGRVCRELMASAERSSARVHELSRPNYPLRATAGLLSIVIVTGLLGAAAKLNVEPGSFNLQDFVQILEAAINDMVLTGAAIWFLLSLETRFKRRRALAHIHEMRAIAHVIDMHQLTKAPELILGAGEGAHQSPKRLMNKKDLSLYLDYCSEMLSLTSKVAVLYVQNFDDGEVRAAVNEVEDLTTGLSRKIWQKMVVLNEGDHRGHGDDGASPSS